MKRTLLTAILLAAPAVAASAQSESGDWNELLDSAVVSVSYQYADDRTPVALSQVSKASLEKASPMASLPMALSLLPSVVTYNEGGTGLGNSAMIVRGVKGSRINVTLNGITLNDAESQEVFWVNIPAMSALLSRVQLQRGLGTTAGGSGAFGASLRMDTNRPFGDPGGSIEYGAGSFGTQVLTLSGSTSRSPRGFSGTAVYSRTSTNGYIRNAGVRSQSALVSLDWRGKAQLVSFNWLLGSQHSGITWDGISPEQLAVDRTYNPAGEYYDAFGNVHYYPKAEDVYRQNHLQLKYSHYGWRGIVWTTTADYTRGDGYDEYYKTGRKFKDFGFPDAEMTGLDGNAYKKSDMTYRKRMGNSAYTLASDLEWRGEFLRVTGGVSASRYIGDHRGELLWAQVLGSDYDYAALNEADAWYRNQGRKTDFSAYTRAEWQPRRMAGLTVYGDLQYRWVHYSLSGRDDKASTLPMDYRKTWPFFNPRGGVSYSRGSWRAYASVSLGHREPGRSDIKENIKGGESYPIVPESMVDGEAGFSYAGKKVSASAGLYAMEYKDMLLETGRLSNSGYAIKENIARGWRRGIELAAAWKPLERLRIDGNLTLSVNQIRDFTAHVEDWENGGYRDEHYGRTTMLLSPGCTAMGRVEWKTGLRGPVLSLDGKWVGKQYLDNTESEARSIPGYFVANASLRQEWRLRDVRLAATLFCGNLLDREYVGSGWTYRAWQGGANPWYEETGLYPQAPRNWMLKLVVAF